MNEDTKLAPCPFCGGDAEINLHDGDAGTWIARCGNRDCTTWPSTDSLSYEGASAAWNRRSSSAPAEQDTAYQAFGTLFRVDGATLRYADGSCRAATEPERVMFAALVQAGNGVAGQAPQDKPAVPSVPVAALSDQARADYAPSGWAQASSVRLEPSTSVVVSGFTDQARLDALDAMCEAYGFEGEHHGNRWTIDGPFRNVRAAIDAAMNPEPKNG